jgi:uncharacterized protein (TIGR02001 family)
MKQTLLALLGALSITAMPALVHAQDASQLSFNISAASDYRYRGISQTRRQPALQGGADYAFSNGFYLGTWASTIKWIKDSGGSSDVELDLYGGYKGSINESLGYDLGFLHYDYPSNKLNPSANTDELYAAISMGPVTVKYSHSLGNLFGFADSKNSGYLDISASFDLGNGLTLTPHIGRQTVHNNSGFSYTDYALSLNKDYAGLSFGLSLVGADTSAYAGTDKDLAKANLLLSVKKSF